MRHPLPQVQYLPGFKFHSGAKSWMHFLLLMSVKPRFSVKTTAAAYLLVVPQLSGLGENSSPLLGGALARGSEMVLPTHLAPHGVAGTAGAAGFSLTPSRLPCPPGSPSSLVMACLLFLILFLSVATGALRH